MMNKHISEDQLIGYIMHTRTDAEREQIEIELQHCAECRAHLQALQNEYQYIRQGLAEGLGALRPSPQAHFAALAPSLSPPHRLSLFRLRKMAVSGGLALMLVGTIALLLLAIQPTIQTMLNQHDEAAVVDSASDVITIDPQRPLSYPLKNADFETGRDGRVSDWTRSGSPAHDYEVSLDTTTYTNGNASAQLVSTTADTTAFGLLKQWFPADDFRGQRVRLSAQVKVESVTGQAGLWTFKEIPGGDSQDLMQITPLSGTTDWDEYEIIWDVPENAEMIEVGIVLLGTGKVWVDAFTFTLVDSQTPLSAKENKLWWSSGFGNYAYTLATTFNNLDFEEDFVNYNTGWSLSDPLYYGIKHDAEYAISGLASARLESTRVDGSAKFGSLAQTIKADQYRGQRIRVVAYIKTEDVENWAGLWLRIDGIHQMLQFDNMQDRPIKGTIDWAPYELVLDVPAEAATINLGILLAGTGRVWLDDVQFEVVDLAVPTTGFAWVNPEPLNFNFEEVIDGRPRGWGIIGPYPQDYRMTLDDTESISEEASALFTAVANNPAEYGLMMQAINVTPYQGERVRLSAWLKTEDLNQRAGLLMRIEVNNQIVAFDNMESRPILGTTDWQLYEVVLDAPVDSTSMQIGILLEGNGRVWVDDVQLEIVGSDVPTTD